MNDDIFAVFDSRGRTSTAPPSLPGLPGPTNGNPYATPQEDPLGHLRDEPGQSRVHLPRVEMPEPRFLLIAIGSGLVVLLVLLVVVLFDGSGDDPPTATPTPAASASTAVAAFTGKTPEGLARLSGAAAADLLRKAGEDGKGDIVDAWTWNDKNGKNLVVETVEVTHRNRQTLRVIHVAELQGDKPRTLRLMIDPDLPQCKNKDAVGAAAFTKNAMLVRDVNGDGLAEVTAGWTSRCASAAGRSEIKLAMITDGDKYIIRDEGVVGQAGTGTAAPKSSRWPAGFYAALTKLYKKLYG